MLGFVVAGISLMITGCTTYNKEGTLGSLQGTLVASLALGLIESYGTIFVGRFLDRVAIAFLFLIAVLIVRPQGLAGRKTA